LSFFTKLAFNRHKFSLKNPVSLFHSNKIAIFNPQVVFVRESTFSPSPKYRPNITIDIGESFLAKETIKNNFQNTKR